MVKKRDWVCFSCDVYSRMIWILSEFCFLQAKTLTARSRGLNNLRGHPTIFFLSSSYVAQSTERRQPSIVTFLLSALVTK